MSQDNASTEKKFRIQELDFLALTSMMKQKLAYYFDTDEHEPITLEIIEHWMRVSYFEGINEEQEKTRLAVEQTISDLNILIKNRSNGNKTLFSAVLQEDVKDMGTQKNKDMGTKNDKETNSNEHQN